MAQTTVTKLFAGRALSAARITAELEQLGDSSSPRDCLLRNALLEILQLRLDLEAEKAIIDTLQDFGLQTLGSIYGVHSTSSPPQYRRQWICWQGRSHASLREAVREAIHLRKGKR